MIGELIAIVMGLIGLAVFVQTSKVVINIRGNKVGIVERKYFGKKLQDGRVIAMSNEVGIQARTLEPGIRFLIPYLCNVDKDDLVEVPPNKIGIVESIDGRTLESGQLFALATPGHNYFQNGEAFLSSGGFKGIQTEVLPPGKYRINTAMFRVDTEMDETKISKGCIGVVTALAGEQIKNNRLLAGITEGHNNFQDGNTFLVNKGQKGPQMELLLPGTYRINTKMFKVEVKDATTINSGNIGLVVARDGAPLEQGALIADSFEGHDNFQNGLAFLKNGGQRGPQKDFLRPGTYYINPFMFEVVEEKATIVPEGMVAVLISSVGKEPDATTLLSSDVENAEKYVVPEGYRGIMEEVLSPGMRYINIWAYKVVPVETVNITIDWNDQAETKFNPLEVISTDGFKINVSVKVVVRVQASQAPHMVARIGRMENLIKDVIHPMVDSSFRNQASATEAMKFLQNRGIQQEEARLHVEKELAKYSVDVVSVLISKIDLPADLMATQTQQVIAQQQHQMFIQQQLAEVQRIQMEKTKAEADKQPELMAAQIDAQIAEQHKLRAITNAEGASASTKLVGEGEAAKIMSIGAANAEAYNLIRDAIGAEGVVFIEIMKIIAEKNIRITPDILMSGKDGGGSVMEVFLSTLLREKKDKINIETLKQAAVSMDD